MTLEQRKELILGEAGFANERAQRALGQFPMVRDGQPGEGWDGAG